MHLANFDSQRLEENLPRKFMQTIKKFIPILNQQTLKNSRLTYELSRIETKLIGSDRLTNYAKN